MNITLNPRTSLAHRDNVVDNCVIVLLNETYLKIYDEEEEEFSYDKRNNQTNFNPSEKNSECNDIIELCLPIAEKFEISKILLIRQNFV